MTSTFHGAVRFNTTRIFHVLFFVIAANNKAILPSSFHVVYEYQHVPRLISLADCANASEKEYSMTRRKALIELVMVEPTISVHDKLQSAIKTSHQQESDIKLENAAFRKQSNEIFNKIVPFEAKSHTVSPLQAVPKKIPANDQITPLLFRLKNQVYYAGSYVSYWILYGTVQSFSAWKYGKRVEKNFSEFKMISPEVLSRFNKK